MRRSGARKRRVSMVTGAADERAGGDIIRVRATRRVSRVRVRARVCRSKNDDDSRRSGRGVLRASECVRAYCIILLHIYIYIYERFAAALIIPRPVLEGACVRVLPYTGGTPPAKSDGRFFFSFPATAPPAADAPPDGSALDRVTYRRVTVATRRPSIR